MKPVIISPSMLSADFANLQRDITTLNNSTAQWLHLDIMDGNFVPNISFGFPVISAMRKHTKKTLDVHLMIEQPERYISDFKQSGADILTVHYEACTHLHRTIQQIKSAGMKAGLSLNPHTPVQLIEAIAADLDLLLIMSVNPGFGGQSFIENTYHKIKKVKEILLKTNSQALIEVDGGVTDKNARQLIDAGADVLVAGSFIFRSENIEQAILQLQNASH